MPNDIPTCNEAKKFTSKHRYAGAHRLGSRPSFVEFLLGPAPGLGRADLKSGAEGEDEGNTVDDGVEDEHGRDGEMADPVEDQEEELVLDVEQVHPDHDSDDNEDKMIMIRIMIMMTTWK